MNAGKADERSPTTELDLSRSRPILAIAAALSAVNAIVQFGSGNDFEGWFSLAFMAPALWLLLDTGRQSGPVGLVRELLPMALLFCVPVVRGVLVGRAWLTEGDRDKSVWSFAIAALFAAAGISYLLWVRWKRTPDHDSSA